MAFFPLQACPHGTDLPPRHNSLIAPMIPRTLVLKPGLVIQSVRNGCWFSGRPAFYDLWCDLRAATAEVRPDWHRSDADAAVYRRARG